MTPDLQRIVIAEARGWTRVGNLWKSPLQTKGIMDGPWFPETAIPDYPSDLNAMHEAEKGLLNSGKEGIWTTYLYWLETICDVPMHHATAAQRAEAFLRTLNLWKE